MKSSFKITLLTSIFCASSVYADPQRTSSYDSVKSVSYATQWAVSKNTAYPFFGGPGQGGDCTNFASQVMRAGGWQFTKSRVDTDVQTWYVSSTGTKFSNSQTWSVADAFHRRLLIVPQEKSAKQIYNVDDLKPGDVVFMVSNKMAHHTMIVTDKVYTGFWFWKKLDIKVSYHNGGEGNTPKFNVSLKDLIATNPSEVFKFVSISA